MQYITDTRVLNAIDSYKFMGEFVGAHPYGCGHINDTYALYFQLESGETRRYLLQRINTNVFKRPDELMKNIMGVTSFLRDKIKAEGGDPERETLNVIRTKKGEDYYTDYDGGCWRCYVFVEDAISYQIPESTQVLYEAARVFGQFQKRLADYPADTLYETIPEFHNTKVRFELFQKALEADTRNRAKDVKEEIQFVMDREADTKLLLNLLQRGELPLRVTHNDTKLNNVLIDKESGKGICAIDLDTVMPGLSLYDFGDAIRTGANPAAEDELNLSKVRLELPFFESYVKGYLSEAGDSLTPKEIELMPTGAKLMTLECGIRFLTDYLEGDTYFKIHREQHNLDRCRTQFKMVADIEAKWEDMRAIVSRCVS